MGIFDFFKKKRSPQPTQPIQPAQPSQPVQRAAPSEQSIDRNVLVLLQLEARLQAMGLHVRRNQEYMALHLDNGLEIATAVIDDPSYHPTLLHLVTSTHHPLAFPDGIEDGLTGLGDTHQEQAETAVENYLANTFAVIQDSLEDRHTPTLDFLLPTDGRGILWHPNVSGISYQGAWPSHYEEEDPLYTLLLPSIKPHLHGAKFHWLKTYVAKLPGGEIIAECNLDNEPWPDGHALLTQFASSWEFPDGFYGMKEMMVFRRCDRFE
jgi:Family of unknown function (DUF6348)